MLVVISVNIVGTINFIKQIEYGTIPILSILLFLLLGFLKSNLCQTMQDYWAPCLGLLQRTMIELSVKIANGF